MLPTFVGKVYRTALWILNYHRLARPSKKLCHHGANNENGYIGMFRNTQNSIMAPSNSQIQAAGRKTVGRRRPMTARASVDRKAYPTNGRANTIRGFSPNAAKRCPLSNWCKPRKVPQPGQCNPVSAKKGQGGKRPESAGSRIISATRQGDRARASITNLRCWYRGLGRIPCLLVEIAFISLLRPWQVHTPHPTELFRGQPTGKPNTTSWLNWKS